jgi:very-short-patch-repair endonuclease
MSSQLEEGFYNAWINRNPNCVPKRQYKWHPKRLFKADFAFVEQRVLVEIMGTRSYKSAHTTVKGYHSDCRRMVEAQILGWRVLYFDSMFDKNWLEAVKLTEKVVYAN